MLDRELAGSGLSVAQLGLLAQIAAAADDTLGALARRSGLEQSTLSRNLKRLLALGHIIMDPPAGRRGRGLHLTPKGEAVIRDAYPVWLAAQQRAVAVLGADSRSVLDDLLKQAEKLAAA